MSSKHRAFLALALIEASAALGDLGNLLAQDRSTEDNLAKFGSVVCGFERAAEAAKKAKEPVNVQS